MPYVITHRPSKFIVKYLHRLHGFTLERITTSFDKKINPKASYFTKDEAEIVMEHYQWNRNKDVAIEFIPDEVESISPKKRKINTK